MTEHVHVWEVTETSGGTHSRCIDCRQESFGGPSTTLIPRATPPDLGPTLLALEKRIEALEMMFNAVSHAGLRFRDVAAQLERAAELLESVEIEKEPSHDPA